VYAQAGVRIGWWLACLYPAVTGPLYRNRWSAELQQDAVERDRRGGDRAQADAQMLYCRWTVIAYVEAEGIGVSFRVTLVVESGIKRRRDRAMNHLL
jgi:hypothetical protein